MLDLTEQAADHAADVDDVEVGGSGDAVVPSVTSGSVVVGRVRLQILTPQVVVLFDLSSEVIMKALYVGGLRSRRSSPELHG